MRKNVKVMHTKLRIMLADFFAVIGHSWDLDQKRSGTELALTNLMVFGTNLPQTGCLNSQKPFIHSSVLPVQLKEESYEEKERSKKAIHLIGSEHNVELILLCVWSRISQTARHSTSCSKGAEGTSGSSQLC